MSPKQCIQHYKETGITHYYADFPFSKTAKIVWTEFGYQFEAEDTSPLSPEDLEWYTYKISFVE